MTLDGKRVLIVEDEFLIALDLADEFAAEGANVVRTATSVDDALDIIANTYLDGAVIDVKLTGQAGPDFQVADALADHQVPFIFQTGARPREVPARHANVPWLEKPFAPNAVCRALESVMRPALQEC